MLIGPACPPPPPPACFWILRKIRKSQVRIEDSVFWLLFSLGLILLSLFPQLASWAANLIGVVSPVNFVFLSIISIPIELNSNIIPFLQRIKVAGLDPAANPQIDREGNHRGMIEKFAQNYAQDYPEPEAILF